MAGPGLGTELLTRLCRRLSAMFSDLPLSDVLILLAGLPLAAAAGAWLLAGREPPVVARQPLD